MAARANEDEPEEASFGAPLPKDDRLWRHPSELADPAPTPPPESGPRRVSRWRFRRHPNDAS